MEGQSAIINGYSVLEVGKETMLPWMSGCELSGSEKRSEDAMGLDI